MPSAYTDQILSGWGRFPAARCHIFRPERDRDLGPLAGILPRGMGRSYGDAALDGEKGVVATHRLDRMLAFDKESGLLEAEAGLILGEIAHTFLPRGWFLPVTPGTKFVSLGGAVAGDVHGKNHHVDGAFTQHVEGFELLCPTGERLSCSRQEHADVFDATAGGMGLTGLITRVRLRLRRVEGPWMQVRHLAANNLEEMFGLLSDPGIHEPYTVAWIDCLARGRSLGRSVMMIGDHARGLEPGPELPLAPRHRIPFDLPAWVLNSMSIKVFNEIYFRRQSGRSRPFLAAPDAFFYPLDGIGNWNRMYGRRGFLQYQCVLPEGEALAGIQELLERISRAGAASFLAVLKRLGQGSGGNLSFPLPGFTLALDLPHKGPETLRLVQELDREVLKRGGRVNLCKDACLAPESFRQMYPAFDRWLEVKKRVDPDWTLQSEMSRRLRLREGC